MSYNKCSFHSALNIGMLNFYVAIALHNKYNKDCKKQ